MDSIGVAMLVVSAAAVAATPSLSSDVKAAVGTVGGLAFLAASYRFFRAPDAPPHKRLPLVRKQPHNHDDFAHLAINSKDVVLVDTLTRWRGQ